MSSNVNFVKAIKAGFAFAFNIHNFLLYFVILLIEMGILAGMAIVGASYVASVLATGSLANLSALITVLIPTFIGLIIVGLIDLLLEGAFIYRFKTGKSINKSISYSLSRFLTMILVAIVIIAITFGILTIVNAFALVSVSLAPAVSIVSMLVSIIIALVFLFAYQEVILAKSGVVKTLKNSWAIFKSDWINILVTIIIVGIIGAAIVIIAAIPLIIAVVGLSVGNFATITDLSSLVAVILQNIGPLAITGVIVIVGLTITKLLSIGVLTHVYSQIKKLK